jgi:hypothetical protein
MSSLLGFDKLRGVENTTPQVSFSFICSNCRSRNIDLIPSGVVFKRLPIDNTDLPDRYRLYYNSVSYIQNILLNLVDQVHPDIHMYCEDCHHGERVFHVEKPQLRKWVKEKYGDTPFELHLPPKPTQ